MTPDEYRRAQDAFDKTHDAAYAALTLRKFPRQARKDALLEAAALGKSFAGRLLALGAVDTVVTYDRDHGYTVRDPDKTADPELSREWIPRARA